MIRYFLVFSIGLFLGGLIWKSGYDAGMHDKKLRDKTPPANHEYVDDKVRTYRI